MADNVNANINIDIDSSSAISELNKLQAKISAFNQSVIASNATAVAAQRNLNSQLISQVSAIKGFSTSIVNVQSDLSRLSGAIDKQKLSLSEYFRYGAAASKTFGRVFSKEHNEILSLAEDRVKRLNTQYVAIGQSQNGFAKALAARPIQLFNAEMAIANQRSQLFNKLLRDGSTNLINWGKNTQWAGRQLMVGFSLPIAAFGTIAGKTFIDLEKQVIAFQRVYGDLGTTVEETDMMVAKIKELATEYTKYGIAVSDTIGMAAKAAASGAQGTELIAATEQATRLATLGLLEQEQALTATIALQSAFKMESAELAETIDFLNAVENQTVVSLDDITVAIPKVAPVIQGLGGDVRDLAAFMAAMREGGVNAAEGANALKSGLASLINPTKNASEMLSRAGINMDGLIKKNRGDLMGLVTDFADQLKNLDKFSRQQVLAKVFGKYQFARMGALFENINRDASQAQRVIDLAGLSMTELANLSEKELSKIEQATSTKFLAAVEKLKLAIAPIGEQFLKVATPIIELVTKIAEKFNELPNYAKNFIVIGTAIGAVLIPSVIMLVGLMANFLGNMVKIASSFRSFIAKIRGGGDAFDYLSQQELDAMAASKSLEGRITSLTSDINIQREAVEKLSRAYATMVSSASAAMKALPQGFRTPAIRGNIRTTRVRGMAEGGLVGGKGNKDSEPALLMPGEFVMNKEASEKYGPILAAMNEGSIAGYRLGKTPIVARGTSGERTVEVDVKSQSQYETIMRRLAAAAQQGPEIVDRVLDILQNFGGQVNSVIEQIDPQIRSAGVSNVAPETKYSAPSWIADQTNVIGTWQSKQQEIEQVQSSVAEKWNVTSSQLDNLIKTQASHLVVVDENGNRIAKSWEDVSNITPDLGAINNYLNRIELMTFDMGEDSEIIQRIMADTGMEYSQVRDEVVKLRKGTHPSTTEALKIFQSLGQIDEELSLFELDLIKGRKLSKKQISNLQNALGVKAVSGYQATGAVSAAQTRIRYEEQNPATGFMATMKEREYSPRGTTQARDAAEEVLDASRTVWRTGSPSEAQADISEEIPRGTAIGIERTTPQATAAAKAMAQEVLNVTENTLDQLSLEQLRRNLTNLPQEGEAARMTRIGSYGGDPRMIVNKVSQGNAAMEAEIARLRALQVEEKAILARIIEIESGELAQRKISLQAAITRKQQATRLATAGRAEASVMSTTMPVPPSPRMPVPMIAPGAIQPGFAGPASDINNRKIIPESIDNPQPTIKKIDSVKNAIGGLATKLGGVSIAATMAAGAFSGMEGPVGEFANKIFPLLGILDLLTIPMMFIGTAGPAAGAGLAAAGAAGAAAGTGLTAAGAGGAAAGAGLAAAIWPITAVIAALAALGVAFKVIYDRSEPLRVAVDGLVETISKFASIIFGELIAAFNQLFGLTGEAGTSFSSFGDILQKVADVAGPVLARAFEMLTGYYTVIGNGIRILIKYWQALFTVFRMVATVIMGAVAKAFSWLMDKLGPIGDIISDIGSKIAEAFSNIGPIIANTVSEAARLIEDAVNMGIGAINGLIDAFNSLPDFVRLGTTISRLDEFTLEGPSQGDTNQPYYGTGDTYAGMTANDYRKMGKEQRLEEDGFIPPEEPSAGGAEKQKSWLESLAEEVNANYMLFVDDIGKGAKSAMDKLRSIKPSIPEQLLSAIGAGPEGLKNARELLNADAKMRKNLIDRWTKSTVGKTMEAVKSQSIAKSQQAQAEQILLSRGFSKESAEQISGNAEYAFAIVSAAAGKSKESIQQVVSSFQDMNAATEETAESQMQWLKDLMEIQALQHKQDMKPIEEKIKAYQDQIDLINEEIEAINRLNREDQERVEDLNRQKELIGRQIEQIERANELDNRRIESLKREDEMRNRVAQSLNQQLDELSKQEAQIKESYDKRISSLEQVAKINDYLINQQKTQINLAQALSSGDAYAAAQAQQEMQAEQTRMAQERQKEALEQGRENAIGGLTTAQGLTRAQAEQQIDAIKNQSYQTSLKIRDIEDEIYNRNQSIIPLKDQQYQLDIKIRDIQDAIYLREEQIESIQSSRLAPLQQQLSAQQKIKEQKEDEFQAQVDSQNVLLDQARLTDLQRDNVGQLAKNWYKVGQQILAANKLMDKQIDKLGDAPEWDGTKANYAEYQSNLERYNSKRNEIIKARNASANDAYAAGVAESERMSVGGLVVGSGARDSVSAKLTPNEFVIRRAMVKKYGEGMFQSINQGSFQMPKYQIPSGSAPLSVESSNNISNIVSPVYNNNYSINVPVNQPNASADEIAYKVMTKIKSIDSANIRRVNGY